MKAEGAAAAVSRSYDIFSSRIEAIPVPDMKKSIRDMYLLVEKGHLTKEQFNGVMKAMA